MTRMTFRMKTVYALVAAPVLALASVLPAQAAIYMKLDGIKGATASKGHKEWINLESVHCGSAASSPSLNEIVVTKGRDAASPALQEAVANRRTFASAVIDIEQGGRGGGALRYELQNVMISSYQTSAATRGGAIPTETLSLNFDKITWKSGAASGEGCAR